MTNLRAYPLFCLLLFAGAATAAPGEARQYKHDPLTEGERQRMQQHQQRHHRGSQQHRSQQSKSQQSKAQQRRSSRANRRNQAQPLADEPILLLLERQQDKVTSARYADAYYYNYYRDETTHEVLDLTSGEPMSSEVLVGVQLPLVETEVNRAFSLVWHHPVYSRMLADAYVAATSSRLDRSRPIAEQLSFKAFVFHPDTLPTRVRGAGKRCGVQRCAQLLVYTVDNVALNFSPLVSLSKAKVLQNLEGGDLDAF